MIVRALWLCGSVLEPGPRLLLGIYRYRAMGSGSLALSAASATPLRARPRDRFRAKIVLGSVPPRGGKCDTFRHFFGFRAAIARRNPRSRAPSTPRLESGHSRAKSYRSNSRFFRKWRLPVVRSSVRKEFHLYACTDEPGCRFSADRFADGWTAVRWKTPPMGDWQ